MSEKIFLSNCYKSIDELPIYYWDKIHTTGNLFLLDKTGKKSTFKFKVILFEKLWRKIIDEFVEKFGFSDNFIAINRKTAELIRLISERATEDNRSLNAFIKIAYEELAALKKSSGGGDFWELKGALDRAGFRIDTKTTSVTEFYSHVKTLSKQQK